LSRPETCSRGSRRSAWTTAGWSCRSGWSKAVAMWGVAAVVVRTVVGGGAWEVTSWVYRVAALLLVALAVVTVLTGAGTKVIWFKICPALLTGSELPLLVASLV
jgi:hypothetical protein